MSGRIKDDLTDRYFGKWHVLRYAGNRKWTCECTCGTVRDVMGTYLRNGRSTGCGHDTNRKFEDLTDMYFGEWHVLEYIKGEMKWLCECSCGKKQKLSGYQLKYGKSKSCGHATTGLKDLTGMHFGEWEVLHRDENDKGFYASSSNWVCRCSCGTIKCVTSYALRTGSSTSCGCKTEKVREQTCLEKYGVKHASQIGTTRTKEQLEMIETRENLLNVIQSNFSYKPKSEELGKILGLDRASTMLFIHKYELDEYININPAISSYENELNNMFPGGERSNRKIIDGKELDLYYPNAKLAIEFNGDYWHSELKKPKNYHQEKSITAYNKRIHLIHIFEYEWKNKDTHDKIIQLITQKLYPERTVQLNARQCEVKQIDKNKANEFLDKYHLQGANPTNINYGLLYENELVGVMTFGTPRFNIEYQYELIRLAFKSGIIITGGAQRLFTNFCREYNPESVISYCDLSKFNGKVYTNLGFKYMGVSQPSYKWVNIQTNKVLSRYQTMKDRLVSNGLGTKDESEADVMHRLGYFRMYDCGNLRFVWNNPNTH